MSGVAMEWGARQGLKGFTQLVLLRLCFHHNHETGRCDPSIATLAEGAGISADKARRCMREIERAGLLETETRKVGKVNTSNAYRLRMEKSPETPVGVLAISQGVPAISQGGYPTAAGGVLAISQANKEENKEVEQGETAPTEKPAGQKAKLIKMAKPAEAPLLPDLPAWIDTETFAEWMQMRANDLRKPVSFSVAKASIKKLGRMRQAGHDPNKVLEQATLNQWQGLFTDKDGGTLADPPEPGKVQWEPISFEEAFDGHLTGTEAR